MTDPTPQAEQRVCMHCGVAIKPWTDRYVDMAGGELCQDGTQGQFPRRHTPAEPAIEVAPQGKIPLPGVEMISRVTMMPIDMVQTVLEDGSCSSGMLVATNIAFIAPVDISSAAMMNTAPPNQ